MLGIVAATAACGDRAGGSLARAKRPPEASPTATAGLTSIELEGNPAPRYQAGPADEQPLVKGVARRLPSLRSSSCLQRAARAHLALPLDFKQRIPLDFTEFALHWAGCPDPTATVSVLVTNERGVDPLLAELARVADGGSYTHVGIASAPAPPRGTRWFALLVDRRMEMAPVPTSVEPGDSVALQFRLAEEFSRATIAVTTPGGATTSWKAGLSDSWVVSTVDMSNQRGRQWLELIGHAPDGPKVLALFPIEIGRAPPRRWVGKPEPDESWVDSTEEAEALAARLVREDRQRFALPRLEWDARLATIARAHSRDMADEGYFAHISPRTGSVVDRLEAAGYPAVFVAENIAMAPTLAEAEESLMRSPGHRAAILSPEATHLGIGVVIREPPRQGRVLYVTQIFVRRPGDTASPAGSPPPPQG